MNFDADRAVDALREAGYSGVEAKANLLTIARANGVTPQALYEIVSAQAAPAGDVSEHPGGERSHMPPVGLGKLSLGEICARDGRDPETVMAALAAAGIEAAAGDRLRDIASHSGMTPGELYRIIDSR